MLFSILIPTLDERRALFERLVGHLHAQIQAAGLQETVELLALCDNRTQTLGAKRNQLIDRARGEFIAFVDDDDEVADTYVRRIADTLRAHPDVDCLGITGKVYFRRVHPRRFVYALPYDHYFSRGGVYYRPPYMLNPIRRALAVRFRYAETNLNEDMDWAMRVERAKILKKQVMLDEILYHYYSRRDWRVQRAIDLTEPIRHPLGLQFANRLRVQRWLNHARGAKSE